MAKSKPSATFKSITKARGVIIDLLEHGWAAHRIHAYGEEDVDDAIHRLKVISEKLGRKISVTAFFVTCWASTVANHKILQAYRINKRNMIIFDEVDCVVNIEKDIEGRKVPTSYIVRNADKKNVIEISDEIREAQQSKSDSAVSTSSKNKQSKARFLLKFPRFMRKFFVKRMVKNPYMKKELYGTIGLSSIGMFTMGTGSAISLTVHASSIIIGGIGKRPWVVNDKVVPRYAYTGTITMDHDLVDGGPAARAIAEFRTKTRTAYGLDEIEKKLGL
ncbi:MAG: 2-oxo acid dehydrogenase subunit E2 [Candidatus Lokiarchaeota archaeon]|nr:2-oxo acid dehydrogenase subunit E2 [Candidatus Lokiarchaeota archaeon]